MVHERKHIIILGQLTTLSLPNVLGAVVVLRAGVDWARSVNGRHVEKAKKNGSKNQQITDLHERLLGWFGGCESNSKTCHSNSIKSVSKNITSTGDVNNNIV